MRAVLYAAAPGESMERGCHLVWGFGERLRSAGVFLSTSTPQAANIKNMMPRPTLIVPKISIRKRKGCSKSLAGVPAFTPSRNRAPPIAPSRVCLNRFKNGLRSIYSSLSALNCPTANHSKKPINATASKLGFLRTKAQVNPIVMRIIASAPAAAHARNTAVSPGELVFTAIDDSETSEIGMI